MTTELDTFDGERVLWVGRPVRWPIFDVIGVLLTAVGIYSIAGAVYAVVSGARDGNAMTITLAVLLGVCVLAVVIGRPVLRRASLRTTEYVLTESRIVVRSTNPRDRQVAARLRELGRPTLSMRDSDNTGTIRFDGSTVVLLEIENPRQVQQLIISAQADLGSLS